MASAVGICNRALGKLGAATISSLDEDDPKAVVLNVAYPLVRDAELRRRRWRFALKRASLPADANTPAFGYAYQYVLPADCLRVIQVGAYDLGPNLADYRSAPNEIFSVEGRAILTNLPAPLAIRYTARIEDTGLYDAAFVEALAARLAYECCKRITGSDSSQDRALVDYRMAVREAVRANALEIPPGYPTDDTWIVGRYQ